MTFDSAFSPASSAVDTGDSSSSVTVSAPTKGRKVRTVKAPSAALFAPITSSERKGRYGLTVDRDDAEGFTVTVATTAGAMRVTYHGTHDRTLLAGLKAAQSLAVSAEEYGGAVLDLPTFRAVTLDAATVSDALAHVLPAMSTDATRYNLSGVYLDVNGNLVATDGHRLHLFGAPESPFDAGVIIPKHAVTALEKAIRATKAESVIIGDGRDMVAFVVMGENMTVEIRARLIDGQFPDYRQVIPSTQGERAFVGDAASVRAAFKAAPVIGDKCVARRLGFTEDGTGVMTLRHDGTVFSAGLAGYATKAFHALFNAKYLDQAFAEMDGAVGVYLADEMSPMRIDNGPRMVIVMPMRA